MFENLIKDKYGLLYSTELLLSIILLVFVIGIIANFSDDLNEKMLDGEELSSLEGIAIESSEYLLNNPGSPEDWEDEDGLDDGIVSSRTIPGLAVKKRETGNGELYLEGSSDEKVIANSISYNKLIKTRNNYDELIDRNLFNGSFKSSMAIIPLNGKVRPVEMGHDFGAGDNDDEIAVVERTVKCDFYSDFVVYDFNDLELPGDDYKREGDCNHDSDSNLENHLNDMRSIWLCKSFRIYKKSLQDYNYYLISDESVRSGHCHWILESLNRPTDRKERLGMEVIDLNPFFEEDMGNSSDEIYSIHFNIEKSHMNDFKTLLVAIPKNMTNDLMVSGELKYDYFKSQEVKYVLKIAYKP